MPNIHSLNFKIILLKPLLHAVFYKDGGRILSILSECSFCIPSILSIMRESLTKKSLFHHKDDWKLLVSGFKIIIQRNLYLGQGLEVPTKYLTILNDSLRHKIKTVRLEAVNSILITAGLISLEYIPGRSWLKKDIKNFGKKINPELLKSVVDLEMWINSYHWRWICERWIGLKWEYPSIQPNFNKEIWLGVLRLFWPSFQF